MICTNDKVADQPLHQRTLIFFLNYPLLIKCNMYICLIKNYDILTSVNEWG